jgi:HlyD family secretion protein
MVLIYALIGVVVVGMILVAVFKKKDPVITVQSDKVARRNLTELVVANGKIQPVVQVVISPEVAGEIVQLPVKEGDRVKKGDLLVGIKRDNYEASRNSAEANHKSSLANRIVAQAELDKAEAEYKRNLELFESKLVSDSLFLEFKTAFEVAKLRSQTAAHQADQASFAVDKAKDDLSKTTIESPIDGTVTRLQSQLGERVLGTSFNKGTEIMTVSDLNEMEARVDIGEMDVVLMQPGQKARLEVDAFKDRKFNGIVTQVANSSKASSLSAMSSSSSQEATKFEVRVRLTEKEEFRPGMSVSAEIETRYRTNVLTVPMASVTARPPSPPKGDGTNVIAGAATNLNSNGTNAATPGTNAAAAGTNAAAAGTNAAASDKKAKDAGKPIEVVFAVEGDHAKMVPVKIGICDDSYWEITEGLTEGQEIVSGGYKAISRDLADGKKIRKGTVKEEEPKK